MRCGLRVFWIVAVVTAVAVGVAKGQAAAPATPVAAANFAPGAKVEVREGDEWSAGTIEKKEGRKFQIKYDSDGSEEWVTADRLRSPGAGGSAPAATAPAGSGAPAAAKAAGPKPLAVNIGDEIEVKWGGSWHKATVKNKGSGWVLVNYAPGSFFEWVEPWRMRKIGSTTDVPWASGHEQLFKPEPPPKTPPGPMPQEERASGGSGGASKDPADGVEPPIKEANIASAKEVIVMAGDAKWSLTADPEPAGKPVSGQPIVIRGGLDVHDRVLPVVFASEAQVAALARTNPFHKAPMPVERLDLAGGGSTLVELGTAVMPLDLSADGTLLLARSNTFGFGGSARLDLWNIASAKCQHVVSFVPYGDKEGSQRDIAWAAFVGPERVATMNGSGRLIVWDVKNANAVWAADVANVTPALSGGRKQIAAVVESQLVVLDAASGKTLSALALPAKILWGRISFRPDGKQIALATNRTLSIWDATTGAPVGDAPYDGAVPESIDWPSDGYVLLDGRTLLDLQQKMPLWQYQGGKVAGMHAGRVWYIADLDGSTKKTVMTSAALPSENVKRAAKSAKPEEIWAAQPGTSVSLEAGSVPGDIQAKALEALKSKLTANGFKIADGQPVKLVASVEAGKPVEISYRSFGQGPFGGTKVSATPQTIKVAFVDAEGKTLWQRQIVKSPPPMLMLKEGQTTEGAVAEATKPDERFFVDVALPKFVPKAQYRNGLGTSELTARGVVDAKAQASAK